MRVCVVELQGGTRIQPRECCFRGKKSRMTWEYKVSWGTGRDGFRKERKLKLISYKRDGFMSKNKKK